ncbi:MAG: hypothetical protein KAT65_16550 [Methanophagales archaeon]|jgi:hypothetical protein|nr:hypothetical protein [Methanophagales archaeon]
MKAIFAIYQGCSYNSIMTLEYLYHLKEAAKHFDRTVLKVCHTSCIIIWGGNPKATNKPQSIAIKTKSYVPNCIFPDRKGAFGPFSVLTFGK